MSITFNLTTAATSAAAFAHPHITSTAKSAAYRTWHAPAKFADYANFYAVDEATGAAIG